MLVANGWSIRSATVRGLATFGLCLPCACLRTSGVLVKPRFLPRNRATAMGEENAEKPDLEDAPE